jgi:two-component system alkaline phosphatase synthesis response regulator PhoP
MEYSDGRMTIDSMTQRVTLDGLPISLTKKESELLLALAANEGETVNRRFLLREIWGYPDYVQTRTLDVHVRRLRKKLGAEGSGYIETVFNTGYRFRRPRVVNEPTSPFAYAMTA